MAAVAAMVAEPRSSIVVRTLDGRELSVTLPMDEGACASGSPPRPLRAWRLKQLLRDELGIPQAEMKLLIGEQVLGDSESVPATAGQPMGLPLTLVRSKGASARLPAFLARYGFASPSCRTHDGSTVLHMAVFRSDEQLCREILQHGEFWGLGVVDFLGNTALHLAAERGQPEVCKLILEQLSLAPDAAVTEVLLRGANRNGRTVLHLAALRGDAATCRAILTHPLLADQAALVGTGDAIGYIAAELAESAGHSELARSLQLIVDCASRGSG